MRLRHELWPAPQADLFVAVCVLFVCMFTGFVGFAIVMVMAH